MNRLDCFSNEINSLNGLKGQDDPSTSDLKSLAVAVRTLQETPPRFDNSNQAMPAQLDDNFEAANDISNKDGAIWQCIGRRVDDKGGFIYQYRLRDIYDDVTPKANIEKAQDEWAEKTAEIFPAIEGLGFTFLFLDPKALKTELRADQLEFYKYVNEFHLLGYKAEQGDEGMYLELPDRETLLARWEELRKTRLKLPELTIMSSEGVASDLAFVEAFFTHHALLSSGKEFVHDHQLHILPTIQLMLSGAENNSMRDYTSEKSRLKRVVGVAYRRIKIANEVVKENMLNLPEDQLSLVKAYLPKMEKTLGILVDLITSMFSYEQTQGMDFLSIYQKDEFFLPWADPRWKKYLEGHYPGERITRIDLIKVWETFEEIEEKFDALPKAVPPSTEPKSRQLGVFNSVRRIFGTPRGLNSAV